MPDEDVIIPDSKSEVLNTQKPQEKTTRDLIHLQGKKEDKPKNENPPEPTTQLLKNKYDLHKAPEVEAAAKRTKAKTGEKIPQEPKQRIQNYLERFKEITDRTDPDKREHGIDAIKRLLYKKYIIKPSEVPESYFELQKRIAREQGHGDIQITPEMRKQLIETIITDQKASLDNWIDYLSSQDAPYSDSLKYFTLRNVLNMSEYDKEKRAFLLRSKGTVKPFPELNREALAYVLDAVEKKYKKEDIDFSSLDPRDQEEFETLLLAENFPKLYTWALEKSNRTSEILSEVTGKWVKYDRGSDHMPLVNSLQGKGTGWCTAGESTARMQLDGGDFYVYYSNDKDGKPTVPRVAIRMSGEKIGEVRGTGRNQDLEDSLLPIVEEKLKEFPDGPGYQKRVKDMKMLTQLNDKVKEGKFPTIEEINFVFEVRSTIQGFGYQKDPRINETQALISKMDFKKYLELLSNSSSEEFSKSFNQLIRIKEIQGPILKVDLDDYIPLIFNCKPEEFARDIHEITPNTKAYIGPIVPGVLDLIYKYNIENAFTEFPFAKIQIETIEIGKKTIVDLEEELYKDNINYYPEVDDLISKMKKEPQTVLPQILNVAIVPVNGLGFRFDVGNEEDISKKAEELGVDLCPYEVSLYFALKHKDELKRRPPLSQFIFVSSHTSYGERLFSVGREYYGSRVSITFTAGATPKDRLVFVLRG